MSTVSELLIRRTVFGGRGRFLMPSEAFNRLKSIGCAVFRLGQPGRTVTGCNTSVAANVTP